MPAPRVLDLTTRKAEPTGTDEFFADVRSYYKNKEDSDIIGGILGEYEKAEDKSKGIQKAIFDTERNNQLSPSRKLAAMKTLRDQQDANLEERKLVNSQAKVIQDNLQASKGRDSLEKAGATPEQLDLYDAAPVGGKTKVVESIVEDLNRRKTPEGLVAPGETDYDKDLLPKERVKRQDARYAAQSPILMKNSETIHNLENESMSLGLLQELDKTGRIGEGLHQLNINPKTGDLFLPKAGTREEQLFVKTVNDFTVKAKDSFGARVTNFELDRFMQRIPTLANSAEGRELIIRQMQIVNQINGLEKREIQKVFDQYGVRNIDYADAETKARKSIEGTKEALRKEYYNFEQVAKQEESEYLKKVKDKTPEGFTTMRKPDGSLKNFPNKNVSALEEKGYKKI